MTTASGVALAVLVWIAIAAPAAFAAPGAARASTRYAQLRQVCPPPSPGHATCFAIARVPVPAGSPIPAGASAYTVNEGAASAGPAGGLTPALLASAYDYNPEAGGSGQTIALVDAYDDPKIEEDLATFDSEYGLAACTKANGCFTKVGQTGRTTVLPKADKEGWSVEISLDVETARGVCPKCKILLVEAKTNSYEDLAAAVDEAVSLGATEVSNSYGGPEIGWRLGGAYNHPGVVIAASTGDDGYYNWDLYQRGRSRRRTAECARVASVRGGGRRNHTAPRCRRHTQSETVWNNNGPATKW